MNGVGRGASVSLNDLEKSYDRVAAVAGVSLDIHSGEFLTLLGPSGSGKTTTLMMIAGFETPTGGDIAIDGKSVVAVPPYRRNIGMVFQNYALFPHLTVADNIGFPLKQRGVAKAERAKLVGEALELVHLPGYGERYPRQLSGGQQQRVALARAIVFKPRLLLMDEPLGALDKQLRENLQLEMRRLHADLGITFIYVTHDQEEALTMSDRIAVMNEGLVAQVGRPEDLYDRPSSRFVAGFIGESNFLPAIVRGIEDDIVVAEYEGATIRALSPSRPAGHGRESHAHDASGAPPLRRPRLEFGRAAEPPQRHRDRGGLCRRTLPLHAPGGQRYRHRAEGAVECGDPASRGRRAGGDRLVDRGYDPCLRRSTSVPPGLPHTAGRRGVAVAAGRTTAADGAASALHVGALRRAGAVDVDAQRQRSGLDAVALCVAGRRHGLPEGLPEHALHLVDRHHGSLLLGYPVALSLVRAPRWAPVILILILLPFWTSVLVRSYAWMVLLGRHGLINEALLAVGMIDRPLRILNTPLATQIAMIHILLPYMVLPIANALRQIDPSLARASSGLGATPWATFRQITLPLSMPGVAAGVLLVFVLALGFYITPAMVGGPREITLSMLIAQQVDQLKWAMPQPCRPCCLRRRSLSSRPSIGCLASATRCA